MKQLRKWLIRVGITLLVIMILLVGLGIWFVRHPWPQVNGTIEISGLTAPVEVIRDRWGVPHIYTQNEHDLFFAQGYVHAQDRLWQMEMNRRFGSGTLSEILGTHSVEVDRLVRTLGLRRVAEQSWTELDSDSQTILNAYAEGVNAYINTHRDRLPLEFIILNVDPEPWSPIDSLSWGNIMAASMTHHARNEIEYAEAISKLGKEVARQLWLATDRSLPVIVPTELESYNWLSKQRSDAVEEWLGNSDSDWGSNNWIVHGDRTTTGKPFLVNDTHVRFQMPSLWYENGLHGGRFNSVGFTFPGSPLIVIGHNQRIAWGITNLPFDNQDNYIEKLDNLENPTQYDFMGKWYNLEFVQETIKVKGDKPVTLNIPFTRHGPIINIDAISESSDEKPAAIMWTLYEGNMTFRAIVHLNLAGNWDEFRAALRYCDVPAQNFVYADVDGNIGYQAAGKAPIRKPEHQGTLPVPGWTGEYEWQGFIPFDDLPTAFNPPAGFFVTANNRIISDDYPYELGYGSWHHYRAKRIIDLLSADDHITFEDMLYIQGQTYLPVAETLLPYVLMVESDNDIQAEALAHLKSWNLYHEIDSVGASIYEVWYMFMVRNTIGDEYAEYEHKQWVGDRETLRHYRHESLMEELMADPKNALFDNINTPDIETRDDIVHRSLTDAVDWLSERFGENTDRWEWGRLHTVTLTHIPLGQTGIAFLEQLFNSRTIPAPGDYRTVNQARYRWHRQQFEAMYGTVQRMVLDLNDWDSMLTINLTGQSGHLFHPHREDQFLMWRNVEYHPMPFTREAVEENAEAVLVLMPQ